MILLFLAKNYNLSYNMQILVIDVMVQYPWRLYKIVSLSWFTFWWMNKWLSMFFSNMSILMAKNTTFSRESISNYITALYIVDMILL